MVVETPKARVAPSLVVRQFVSRWLRCRSSVCSPAMTASGSCQPQSAELVARSRGWTCGPTLALRDWKKEDAHPRLRYWCFLELGHSRIFPGISTSERNPASFVGRMFRPTSRLAGCYGSLQSCLFPRCASPHSTPLRPPHPASLPVSQAFVVVALTVLDVAEEQTTSPTRTAPHPASVIMLRSCLPPHHDSSPPPRIEATRTVHREGERTLTITRSHCRWRSCRLKWNLFAARPLFHLTRHALQRPDACIGFAADLKTSVLRWGEGGAPKASSAGDGQSRMRGKPSLKAVSRTSGVTGRRSVFDVSWPTSSPTLGLCSGGQRYRCPPPHGPTRCEMGLSATRKHEQSSNHGARLPTQETI